MTDRDVRPGEMPDDLDAFLDELRTAGADAPAPAVGDALATLFRDGAAPLPAPARPHARRSRRARVAVAGIVAGVTFGGLGAAGALPGPVQRTVADVVDTVGVHLPDGEPDPATTTTTSTSTTSTSVAPPSSVPITVSPTPSGPNAEGGPGRSEDAPGRTDDEDDEPGRSEDAPGRPDDDVVDVDGTEDDDRGRAEEAPGRQNISNPRNPRGEGDVDDDEDANDVLDDGGLDG